MASLHQHTDGTWRIRFRFGGKQFYRSLETSSEKEAGELKATVDRTLRHLNEGVLSLPPDASPEDVWIFLRTGGKLSKRFSIAGGKTLGNVVKAYFDALPPGAKEDSSLVTERIHANHLERILRKSTSIREIGAAELQAYVNRRAKKAQPVTIKKELQTFNQLWAFAVARGWAEGPSPKGHVALPRSAQKPPFQTFDQIKKAIKRGESEDHWEALFLRESEVLAILQHVKKKAQHPFVYPMLAFAALTGARRSEIIRSEIGDWDLENATILIREKKRVRSTAGSSRQVPVSDKLVEIMREWFKQHPGGKYAICTPPAMICSQNGSDGPQPLTAHQATNYLKRALAGSKWEVVRGFHVFRHSFASICAMKGVHPSIIDSWIGHQTEEMRRRYRHLFPEETTAAVAKVFNGS